METGFCMDAAPAKLTAESAVAHQLCQNAWFNITKEYRALQQQHDFLSGQSRLRFDAPEQCMPSVSDPKHMYIGFSGVDDIRSSDASQLTNSTGIRDIVISWTRNSDSTWKGSIKVSVSAVMQAYTTTVATNESAMKQQHQQGMRKITLATFLCFLAVFAVLWYCYHNVLKIRALGNVFQSLIKEIPRTA